MFLGSSILLNGTIYAIIQFQFLDFFEEGTLEDKLLTNSLPWSISNTLNGVIVLLNSLIVSFEIKWTTTLFNIPISILFRAVLTKVLLDNLEFDLFSVLLAQVIDLGLRFTLMVYLLWIEDFKTFKGVKSKGRELEIQRGKITNWIN